MGEDHGLLATPENLDIVSLENGRHRRSVEAEDQGKCFKWVLLADGPSFAIQAT
jgi:hypothetical protein